MEQFNLSSMKKAREGRNFKVVDNSLVNSKKCLVCFSSNGLYFPNVNSELERVLSSDRYEWESIVPYNKYSRIIFVRDVYKQWYIEGISEDCNSIYKVAKLLKELCSGYDSIFIGSSAGGYAAALIGKLAGAEYSLCFAAQFDLSDLKKDKVKNKLLSDCKYDELINIVDKVENVYYFLPINSEQDYHQYQSTLSNPNIFPILFNSSVHGIPFKPYAVKSVINSSEVKLKRLVGSTHNSLIFSLKNINLADFSFYTKRRFSKLILKIKNVK